MAELFVGRQSELKRLTGILDEVRQSMPRIVMVEGDPGIGKSALLRVFLSQSVDCVRCIVPCDHSESNLDFGCAVSLASRLQFSSAADWNSVLQGLDPFWAGLKLLDCLGAAQSSGSVVIVLDDVQWADVQSLQSLTFTFRR